MSAFTSKVFYITGVSGSGKSTIGKMLSQKLQIPFFDGDDYHPQENIDKMSKGKPLNDYDRKDWLITLNELAKKQMESAGCIIACSALKEKYRLLLSADIQEKTEWIYLYGTYGQIFQRMQKRKNHFMPEKLLKSQFDSIEEPEYGIKVNIELTPEEIIEKIIIR